MYSLADDTSTLYGSPPAQCPHPVGLYTEQAIAVGSGPRLATKKWTPNVRLMDAKMYRAHLAEALDERFGPVGPLTDEEVTHTMLRRGLAGKPGSGADNEGYSPGVGTLVHQTLSREVIPELRQHLTGAGRLGIISPNDCARFAFVLKNLIRSDSHINGTCTVSTVVQATPALANPARRPGDMVILKYPNGGRHGITVVAEDAPNNQIVTLEAHASRLLIKPEFHIYGRRTMAPMLNTWYSPAELVDARSTVTYIPADPSPGLSDASVEPAAMEIAQQRLTELLGRTWRAGPSTNREIWGMVASAGGVPALFRG